MILLLIYIHYLLKINIFKQLWCGSPSQLSNSLDVLKWLDSVKLCSAHLWYISSLHLFLCYFLCFGFSMMSFEGTIVLCVSVLFICLFFKTFAGINIFSFRESNFLIVNFLKKLILGFLKWARKLQQSMFTQNGPGEYYYQ